MAIQNDNTILCKGDLKAYHEKILPYLGGNFMLGTNVSDYYSTDDKIVGVWTDGKPVYQRIVSFLNTTTDFSTHVKICEVSSWNIDNLIFLYGATNNHSSVNQIAVPIGYNTTENDKRIFYICKQDVPNIRENGIWTRGTAVGSLTIIVQYTKTTDVANSAIATPGCYDINRPDLWPANKEIFFGNGLYGQRITGTESLTANVRKDIRINNEECQLKAFGGLVKPDGGTWLINFPYYWNNDNYVSTAQIYSNIATSPYAGLMLFFKSNQTQTTIYDIWVTYTK